MIELNSVTIQQGRFRLQNVSFVVPQNTYAVMMGGTGSGKTTLLEVICGLRQPEVGRVLLRHTDVTDQHPATRNVGYVPQDGALFKTMTVAEQLGFALEIRRVPAAKIDQRVSELAEWLDIEHLLKRMPEGLSGGERQRVALGRAMAFHPDVLLLDEPLSALDQDMRGSIIELLKRVQRDTGITVLHVTHNQDEADQLGDMLLRIEAGQLVLVEEERADGATL